MATDLGSLRAYYSRLSDEALMQVNRDDLVEAAQKCLDDEIAERRLDRRLDAEPAAPPVGDPNWTEGWESVCVFHSPGRGSLTDAPEADEARAAIADAGISCRIECAAADEAEGFAPGFEFRVMVPNGMLLRATSVLDVTIFNGDRRNCGKRTSPSSQTP